MSEVVGDGGRGGGGCGSGGGCRSVVVAAALASGENSRPAVVASRRRRRVDVRNVAETCRRRKGEIFLLETGLRYFSQAEREYPRKEGKRCRMVVVFEFMKTSDKWQNFEVKMGFRYSINISDNSSLAELRTS